MLQAHPVSSRTAGRRPCWESNRCGLPLQPQSLAGRKLVKQTQGCAVLLANLPAATVATKEPSKVAPRCDSPWVDSSRFQGGLHYTVMEVRDYELDQFHVVNNAVYASYVQHARHKALQVLGMSVDEFQAAGTLMALSDLHLTYKAPLRTGDAFYATTAIAQMSAARVVIHHSVVKLPGGKHDPVEEPQVVAEGAATLVFLDAAYKPIRVPAQVKQVFGELAKEYKAATSRGSQQGK